MQARLIGTVFVLVLLLLALSFALLGPDRALSEEPQQPVLQPSATPYPLAVVYPTTAYTARVYRLRERVVKVRHQLAKVRACLGQPRPVAVAGVPIRRAALVAWQRTERQLRHQLRDWRAKTRAGIARMRRPGGHPSGERWIPLARWVGWPESQLRTLVYVMAKRGGTGESGGCPGAFNDVIDCTGLMQMWPGNLAYLHISWSARIAWLKIPENNLRAALRLWRAEGWQPWVL